MSYVKRSLSQDEEIKVEIRLHWLNYLPALIFALLAFWCIPYGSDAQERGDIPVAWLLALLLIFFSLCMYLKQASVEMAVTNKRVICKKGIISVKSEELYNGKVESIEIRQSILGRLMGYGTICFSGTGASEVRFVDIDNPDQIKAEIENIVYNPEFRQ